ncbi:MAG: amidohydrolase [Bacteroidales bacterium]|nr:amidohydrolase [Bacteroidales bacterium]
MKKKADLIIYGAKSYTLDDKFSTVSCIVIRDGKILEVGGEDLFRKYESGHKLDATGMFVYPGFYDAHCHFMSYGMGMLQRADLVGTQSFEEVLERLKVHAGSNSSEWIEGRGWDQNDWKVQEFPDRTELDRLFPDRPVILTRIDGHAALVNGEALRRAGITAQTRVTGGEVLLSEGEPTGLLIDNAIEPVSAMIPEPGNELKKAALQKAQEDCFAVGLTSVMDAGLDVGSIKLIDTLHKLGELKMKINAMLSPADSSYSGFMKKGIYKTNRLHVNSVKLYADGALGSRGACMIEPYSDDPENYGLIMHPEHYYREVMKKAYHYNYQVNTHAIGDSGNRYTLDLYASYLKGPNDRRWRIEHAQIVHPDDFRKFADFNIIPSVQATHATSDMYWAGDRIGEERMKGAYAFKKLLATNGWLPNGTDFPIENISPIHTFYAAVVRKDLEGYPGGGFQMEGALNREEALRSITIWAAKGSFEENEKGSLEAGKAADIVILDSDLMQMDGMEIPQSKVLYTIVNGEIVYKKK